MSTNPPNPPNRPQQPDYQDDELEVQRGRRSPAGPAPSGEGPAPRTRATPPAQHWLPDDPRPAARAPAPLPDPRTAARPPADRRTTSFAEETAANPPASNRGCLILGGMALVTVLACMLLFYGALQSGISRLSGFSFPSFSFPQQTPTIVTTAPAIILQVQALSRLETQRYVIEKVITAQEPGILPAPFTGDKILFVGHGEAVGGVDLGQMQPDDIVVTTDTHKVTLHVPAAELFSVSLDNDKSYVFDRQTGLLTRPDPQLETQVRQEAERQIRQAALEEGILPQAQTNAEKTLRTLLASLGYTDVTFIVKPAPPTPVAVPTP